MPVAAWDKYALTELVWDKHGRPEWPDPLLRSPAGRPPKAMPAQLTLPISNRAPAVKVARIIEKGQLIATPTATQLAAARKGNRQHAQLTPILRSVLRGAGCYVFFASVTGGVKIGISGNILKRWTELEYSAGVPLKLVAVWKAETSDQVARLEKHLHKLFDEHRRLGEWFTASAVLPTLLSDDILKIGA